MKTFRAAIVIICFEISSSLCQAVPAIVGAQTKQGDTEISLDTGCKLYIYGMATGGASSSSSFTEGQSIHIENASGITSAQIAVSTINQNGFTTSTAFHAIGGFGVSGYRYVQGFYGANPGPNATSASVQFTLSAPALVAVLGMTSCQPTLSLSGLDNLVFDTPLAEGSGTVPLAVAHTYLGPGTYTIQETTNPDAGSDPNHMVDLIGILILSDSPSIAKSDSPEIPLSLSQQPLPPPTTPPILPTPPNGGENKPIGHYLILGVAILACIAMAMAVIRLIMPRRSNHGEK